MASGASGGVSCGKGELLVLRSDFLQLRDEVGNLQRVMEERLKAMEERLSKEEERSRKLEDSLQRALDGVLPKVEELLARHQSPASAAPQPTRETSAALHSVAPSVASTLRSAALFATASTDCGSPSSGPSTTTSDPPTSLHEAAERGDIAAVQRCLANGAQVDARDKNGNTALHVAASNGFGEVLDVLIANGSAVDKVGYRSRRPLHCAAAGGHKAIVENLVAARAKVDLRDADGVTAAALAAQRANADLVTWLVEHGTPVDVVDKHGRTLLMYAVEGANINIVAYLLGKGANVNAVNNDGETPLFSAVKLQRRNIVKYLLQEGALPFKIVNKESPLKLASTKGYSDLVGEMLKKATADDAGHLKECLRAAGSAEVVWSFADAAHELVLGPAGEGALEAAARGSRLEVLQALLRVGVKGHRALLAAAETGHKLCVVALLDEGVDVNVDFKDFYCRTALHGAARSGHADCVRELLQRGAKKELKNYDGKTAYDLALMSNKTMCIDILKP